MKRVGHNQFVWGTVPDILKTINKDILLKTDPALLGSTRHFGLPKDIVKMLEPLEVFSLLHIR